MKYLNEDTTTLQNCDMNPTKAISSCPWVMMLGLRGWLNATVSDWLETLVHLKHLDKLLGLLSKPCLLQVED